MQTTIHFVERKKDKYFYHWIEELTYCWVFKFHNCLPDFIKNSELLVFWWVGHYKTEAQSSIQVMLQ